MFFLNAICNTLQKKTPYLFLQELDDNTIKHSFSDSYSRFSMIFSKKLNFHVFL